MNRYCLTIILFFSTLVSANDALTNFQVTDLNSPEQLQESFYLTREHGGGECFQRAHFWSYELFRNKAYKTQKVFIFFSQRYKRLIQGQWWFHVAPSINMQGRPYVLDNEFLKKPETLESWKNGAIDHGVKFLTKMKKDFDSEKKRLKLQMSEKNIGSRSLNYIQKRLDYIDSQEKKYLIHNAKIVKVTEENWPWKDREEIIDLECPEITHYSEYKLHGELYHCFLFKTSMYYFEPRDLEKLEETNQMRSSWNKNEVYSAFRNAFGGRFPFKFE